MLYHIFSMKGAHCQIFYLARGVLSLFKPHLQVGQWHSRFFIKGTGAGWNLVFQHFGFLSVCRLNPVHRSLFVRGGFFRSSWERLGTDHSSWASLSCLQTRVLHRSRALTDGGKSGEDWGSTAEAGLPFKWSRRRIAVIRLLCLLPAFLQSAQVARPQGWCCTVQSLGRKNNLSCELPNIFYIIQLYNMLNKRYKVNFNLPEMHSMVQYRC